MGWAGVKNGRLLAPAEGEFDVLLTADRNISTQQQLAKFQIGVLLVLARSNRWRISGRSFLGSWKA